MFESRNRRRLNNPEVKDIVAGVVREALAGFLKENPEVARWIVTKAVSATKARETRIARSIPKVFP